MMDETSSPPALPQLRGRNRKHGAFVTDREVCPELVGNHRFWESSARFELYPSYSTVRPKAQISGRRIHPYNCRYRPRLLINWSPGASGLREYSYRGIRGSARP